MLNNQRVPSLEQAANDGLDRFRADLGEASSATVDACIVDPELSFMGQAAQRRSHGPMNKQSNAHESWYVLQRCAHDFSFLNVLQCPVARAL
jgi:hypothetical protein